MRQVVLVISASALGLAACGQGASSVGEVSSAQTVTDHWVWNGGGASASWWSETDSAGLSVNENRQAGKPSSAWLSYWRGWADPTSYLCEEITSCLKCRPAPAPAPGECPCGTWTYESCRYTRTGWEYASSSIPSADFRVQGSRAHLATTIGSGPDFWGERCTFDEAAGDECVSMAGQSLHFALDWRVDGESTWTSNGETAERHGKYAYHYVGKFSERSASYDGVFLGEPRSGNGTLGNGVNVSTSRYEVTEP